MEDSKRELAERLTDRVNAFVDLPFIGEEREEGILRPLVEQVVPFIPDAVVPFLTDAVDGLTDEERDRYAQRTLEHVVEASLALVPEPVQIFFVVQARNLFSPIVDAVFDFAQGILPPTEDA